MKTDSFFCPLLSRDIASPLCLSINYAVEGRIRQSEVTEKVDWELAKDTCADCVNAYWNKNNLDAPELPPLKD